MSATPDSKAPWHLWVVGIVSVLWNGFGCYDYLMSQTRNADYMKMMTEPFGFESQAAVDYFDSFPLWADAAWALGVWGALAGSILLLIRRRYAFHAFVASLVGIAGANIYSFGHPLPGMSDSAMSMGMTALVAIVTILLAWYAGRQARAAILR